MQRVFCVDRCHQKVGVVTKVEEEVGGIRLWDEHKLQRGWKILSRLISHHGRVNLPFPCCDEAPPDRTSITHHDKAQLLACPVTL